MSNPVILEMKGIVKSFGPVKALKGVDFDLRAGEVHALMGENGAGKSTLMKILIGMVSADSGRILINGRVDSSPKFGALIEAPAIYPNLSAFDNLKTKALLYGITDLKIRETLEVVGLSDTGKKKAKDFSLGMKQRLGVGMAILTDPEFLILDEPTNGLDIQSITWLEDFLIDFDNTVIVVSHDRHFLNKVCTHMADLDFGKIKLYVGNYDFWKESSELAAKLLADRNAKAEEKIKQLQEFVARFSANASKSKQATSRKKMLDKIELEEIVPSSRKYPFINFKAEREIGNDLLTVENLSVKIDGETILDNISFILRPGDKTALIGQNDIQTTALIRALMGDIEYEGTVKWGVTTSQSYLPKDNSRDFSGSESILDWLRQFASKEEDDNTFLRGFLGRMLFSGDEVNKSVNVLSGGEKVRVMLSKLMLLKSNVLVLDDPTNHLDLESISSLNDGLKKFKESIIFASHDHEFIQTLANHIIVLSKNGVIDRIDETYNEFLENQEVQAKVKDLWKD